MSDLKIYWNNRKNNWIKNRNNKMISNAPIINYINKISNNETILLDIGTGTGRYLVNFTKYKILYGIDFIKEFITVADKIKPSNCYLFVDDIVNMKFNKKVNIIFTMTCLQHIAPNNIELAIKNITNLIPDDIVLFECNNITYVDKCEYMFGHNYLELFKKYNYYLYYTELYDNNITYIMHFKAQLN